MSTLVEFLFPPIVKHHFHNHFSAIGGSNGNSTNGGEFIGHEEDPPWYKAVGITLALVSGLFIGSSFIFKKKGLIDCRALGDTDAGNSHAYLKSPMWWTGMILSKCNFLLLKYILVTFVCTKNGFLFFYNSGSGRSCKLWCLCFHPRYLGHTFGCSECSYQVRQPR
jgi:hypothetical protein